MEEGQRDTEEETETKCDVKGAPTFRVWELHVAGRAMYVIPIALEGC